ncbi:hypothetical protein [Stenotrophomonas acidaminiphila]|uniref:hypothetical protein n=1 Tax=Stenotrophomonas acidaminiphila TaxID=128780 RepID=UPI0020C67295|nr:hypothetical protein [Stenotrophomonas acidaminiphila]
MRSRRDGPSFPTRQVAGGEAGNFLGLPALFFFVTAITDELGNAPFSKLVSTAATVNLYLYEFKGVLS